MRRLFVVVLAGLFMWGCMVEGPIGPAGPAGPQGPQGPAGADGVGGNSGVNVYYGAMTLAMLRSDESDGYNLRIPSSEWRASSAVIYCGVESVLPLSEDDIFVVNHECESYSVMYNQAASGGNMIITTTCRGVNIGNLASYKYKVVVVY